MNDSINTPEVVEDYINKNLNVDSIWLKPNENWVVGDNKDNEESINYWMEFYSNLQTLPKIKSLKTYSQNELEEKYASYVKKIKSRNNFILVYIYNLIFGKKYPYIFMILINI